MSTYTTPEPITARIELAAGSVRLTARDQDDTVVDVRPRDASRAADVRAAEQASVDLANGTLRITTGPKGLTLGRGGAVDIDVALPSRSRLQVSSSSADVSADGLLADCHFSSAGGRVELDAVEGNLDAETASGDIAAKRVLGNVTISTSSGDAVVGVLDGDLRFDAASGGLTIGVLRGDARVQTASGPAAVTTAVHGTFTALTSGGEVQVGIPRGTAARLDVKTKSGVVHNGLDSSDGPANGEQRLRVHARTGSGDISVRRSEHAVA